MARFPARRGELNQQLTAGFRTITDLVSGLDYRDFLRKLHSVVPSQAANPEKSVNELRLAFRQLFKNPGFTAVAVLTLALGVGACVSIFSVANAMLLRDRPYGNPGRLVWVWQRNRAEGPSYVPVSVPNFFDWQQQATTFEQLAAFDQAAPDLEATSANEAPTQRIGVGRVTVNLFSIVGVKPLLGRTFLPTDEKEPVVVMSHTLWQSRFNADPQIVNRAIRLNGRDLIVIGVMPAEFHFPPEPDPDLLWVPLSLGDHLAESKRGLRHLLVLGRLKPGVSMKSAQAELETIMARLVQEHPAANANQSAVVFPLKFFWHHPFERIIYVLLGAVGLLTLMACFNVANLLLLKATGRQHEIALRVALGASRIQIVRQLLVESLVLSLLAGAAGLVLAFWGTGLLAATIPLHNYRVGEIEIDATVLAFAVAVSLATGLLFGLAPALTTAKVELFAALKQGGRQSEGKGPQRLRSGLVVAQAALAVVLLTGALLTAQKFFELRRTNWGFVPEGLLTLRLPLPEFRYSNNVRFLNFEQNLRASLVALPGVESATTSTDLPLTGDGSRGREFRIEGQPARPKPARGPFVFLEWINPNYFQTLRLPLLSGRDFTDQEFVAGANVAIINRAMVQQHFAGENPVGKRLRILAPVDGSHDYGKEHVLEIIGVASDVQRSDGDAPDPHAYIPYAQNPSWDLTVAVRATGDPAQIIPAVRKTVALLDPRLPVLSIETMRQRLHDSMADDRVQVLLWVLFAGVAMGLTAVGIFGVISFSVARRTREIAVRMALGAPRQAILHLVLVSGLRLTLAGLVIGLALAWVGWRMVSSQLYVGAPLKPLVSLGVTVSLLVTAALACFMPARRAMKVDPMEALRYE
jgi:putative ABC transport system permease protein